MKSHCLIIACVLCFQVLIKVMTTGVNPVDTYIRAGTYANKPSLPYTPGNDASGVVEEVGSGVIKVKVTINMSSPYTMTEVKSVNLKSLQVFGPVI